MKAIWNDTILAESEDTKVVEENHYFPPESLNTDFLQLSHTHSLCSQKGRASYFHLKVGDAKNPDAAWFYHYPAGKFAEIKDHVAFNDDVKIQK